jgi:hypothetical protein
VIRGSHLGQAGGEIFDAFFFTANLYQLKSIIMVDSKSKNLYPLQKEERCGRTFGVARIDAASYDR